jgi:hypothetical protein
MPAWLLNPIGDRRQQRSAFPQIGFCQRTSDPELPIACTHEQRGCELPPALGEIDEREAAIFRRQPASH